MVLHPLKYQEKDSKKKVWQVIPVINPIFKDNKFFSSNSYQALPSTKHKTTSFILIHFLKGDSLYSPSWANTFILFEG
jgi:hypothetical protein